MKYYDPQKNWHKISPHLKDPAVLKQLTEAFGKYMKHPMCALEYDPVNKPWPRSYGSCDWDRDMGRGRRPEYWKLVKHVAVIGW